MNHSGQSADKNPNPEEVVSRNSNSLGLVTRAMCQVRARELAKIAGRPCLQVWQADYLQAKRELTGETDPELQDAILDSASDSGNWDPVSGVNSHRPGGKSGPIFHAVSQ